MSQLLTCGSCSATHSTLQISVKPTWCINTAPEFLSKPKILCVCYRNVNRIGFHYLANTELNVNLLLLESLHQDLCKTSAFVPHLSLSLCLLLLGDDDCFSVVALERDTESFKRTTVFSPGKEFTECLSYFRRWLLIVFPLHQSVINYYSQRRLDGHMRSSLALDWLGREQRSPGRIGEELQVAQRELVLARRRGIELRFYKEKTDILSLAFSQTYIRCTPDALSQISGPTDQQEKLPLHRVSHRDADVQITPPCSLSSTPPYKHKESNLSNIWQTHTPARGPPLYTQQTFVH